MGKWRSQTSRCRSGPHRRVTPRHSGDVAAAASPKTSLELLREPKPCGPLTVHSERPRRPTAPVACFCWPCSANRHPFPPRLRPPIMLRSRQLLALGARLQMAGSGGAAAAAAAVASSAAAPWRPAQHQLLSLQTWASSSLSPPAAGSSLQHAASSVAGRAASSEAAAAARRHAAAAAASRRGLATGAVARPGPAPRGTSKAGVQHLEV